MNVASVVIPAHNESNVLGPTLERLASDPLAGSLEVAVVANACTDDTAALARSFADELPGLTVLETDTPGKANALNLGDDAARTFPRIYLDADILLGPGALEGLVRGMSVDRPIAGSPGIRFDLDGADLWVREYYRVFERLPYVRDGLIGLGVYALSALGRRRFAEFPDVIADDLFIQRMFTPEERVRTEGHFAVRAPRRWADLVKVRTRVDRGNAQLAATPQRPSEGTGFDRTSQSSLKALASSVAAHPTLLPSASIYVGTTALAKARSRFTDDRSWGRDESSRTAVTTARSGSSTAASRVSAAAPRVLIDRVPFNRQTQAELTDTVFASIAAGQGGRIVTPNVDIMQAARRRAELRELLQTADVVAADGMPIVWASRLRRTPLPERVSGADLVWSFARRAASTNRTIYLLGGRPGIAQRAGRAFIEANPCLRIVGHDSPAWGFEKSPEQMEAVIERLRAAAPDIVYLALGFPKQDVVAAQLVRRLPNTWFLGCGGALDMAAGEVERASETVQRLGGEWLHRLLREPRRLARRYLVDDIPYAARLLTSSTIFGMTGTGRG